MKLHTSVTLSTIMLLGINGKLPAQSINKAQHKNLITKTDNNLNKSLSESQLVINAFDQMLHTINSSWFGKSYENINAVAINGSLSIHLTANEVNARIKQNDDGDDIKVTKNGNVKFNVKGTYFANADLNIEFTGEFGNILYHRIGNKGFLYSKEQNAWTSRVDLPPPDAPTNFSSWFRQCLNEIKEIYTNKLVFQASLRDNLNTQALVFNSNTGSYDPNKKEQSVTESMDFWKHGHAEIIIDKSTHQPIHMTYNNTRQGVQATMDFSYNSSGKPTNISITNKSKGAEGPMSINVRYDNNGLINNISGKNALRKGSISFNLNLNFMQNCKTSSIICVPPPTAIKKGREEMETLLIIGLAEKMMGLQRKGLGLRRPSVD